MRQPTTKQTVLLMKTLIVTVCLLLVAGCGVGLKKPKIAIELPEQYNTPDGMTVDADGNILLSVLNYNDANYPAKIVKIDQNDNITELITLPLHPETGKVGPLGIDVGADGNIYVADNQAFDTEEHKSRLLKIVMKNGKAIRCESVVEGFVMSNAVSCRGDYVYVTETKIDPKAHPLPSGVYRFRMSELNGRKPIKLLPGGKDKHFIIKIYTENKEWAVGANGMAFDAEGNLFVCNFGDVKLLKYTFDINGGVTSTTVFARNSRSLFARGSDMKSLDGMKIHPETGDIYIADFVGNAVHKIDGKTGKAKTIARNGDTDGSKGKLDKPSEVCIRGNKLYIANIDLPFGNTYDKPHTISVIDLD